MLKKIKNSIKKIRKVKYQKIIFKKDDLILREKALDLISNSKNIINNNKKICYSCNFYNKHLNKKNFIIFYKKFNSNLQLKEKYNSLTFKKRSNNSACFKSYLIFSKFLIKNKIINNIQKLNTILKINDLLILKFSEKIQNDTIKDFEANIHYEKKLLKKYL